LERGKERLVLKIPMVTLREIIIIIVIMTTIMIIIVMTIIIIMIIERMGRMIIGRAAISMLGQMEPDRLLH